MFEVQWRVQYMLLGKCLIMCYFDFRYIFTRSWLLSVCLYISIYDEEFRNYCITILSARQSWLMKIYKQKRPGC